MLVKLLLGQSLKRVDEMSSLIDQNNRIIQKDKSRIERYLQDVLSSPQGIIGSFGAGCVVELAREKHRDSASTIPWASVAKQLALFV